MAFRREMKHRRWSKVIEGSGYRRDIGYVGLQELVVGIRLAFGDGPQIAGVSQLIYVEDRRSL